jgi:hypothetical protein
VPLKPFVLGAGSIGGPYGALTVSSDRPADFQIENSASLRASKTGEGNEK